MPRGNPDPYGRGHARYPPCRDRQNKRIIRQNYSPFAKKLPNNSAYFSLGLVDAQQAFVKFVKRTVTPEKARRFAALAETKNGQRKLLDALSHEFESAIVAQAAPPSADDAIWQQPCYVFRERTGFGVDAASMREAYDELSTRDSWLIILCDSSAGIHRPEDRWDDEKFIRA